MPDTAPTPARLGSRSRLVGSSSSAAAGAAPGLLLHDPSSFPRDLLSTESARTPRPHPSSLRVGPLVSAHGPSDFPKLSSKKLDTLHKLVKFAADVVPKQAILENFVHHNPWEHFQHLAFEEAQAHVRYLLGFLSPAERLAMVGSGKKLLQNIFRV